LHRKIKDRKNGQRRSPKRQGRGKNRGEKNIHKEFQRLQKGSARTGGGSAKREGKEKTPPTGRKRKKAAGRKVKEGGNSAGLCLPVSPKKESIRDPEKKERRDGHGRDEGGCGTIQTPA